MVCPAQRPLAAGKSRQTSDDVGDGAGAGHAAGFSHRLSRRLLLAEYTNAGLLLTFWPRPLVFISLMVAIAVLCSWVGALCWNVASQRLPTVILGPLIVFETLAGLLYTFFTPPANAAANDAERYRAVSDWRGHCGQSKTRKTFN